MKITNLIIATVLFLGCGNKGKVETLPEADIEKETANLYDSEIILDTIAPPEGIRYQEVRSVIASQPPQKINLNQKHAEKKIDMADYYSTATFLTLQHPKAEEGVGFLADASIMISIGSWMYGDRGYSSSVELTEDRIIAGDRIWGLHAYNKSGKFEQTIIQPESKAGYDERKNMISMTVNAGEMYVGNFIVADENCLLITIRDKKQQLELYNLASQKVYLKRPVNSDFVTLLNPTTLVSYNYNVLSMEQEPFMHSYDIKGDPLCRFMNYNPLPASKPKTYTNPQSPKIYYNNDVLTVWQPYNDTIFRMTSAKDLVPVYTINLGDRKLDLETALYGKKDGKLIPGTWLETEGFIYISCADGHDTPRNRDNNTVKFQYTVYDKKNKQTYSLPDTCIPEEVLLNNSITGGLPLFASKTKCYKDKLYTSYSKRSLEQLIKSSSFASLPTEQQEKIKQLKNDLSETDLLIMIIQ